MKHERWRSDRRRFADTPAANAGLKKGDVILKLNGQPVNDAQPTAGCNISQMAPGTAVKLQIWRDGKTQDVTAHPG